MTTNIDLRDEPTTAQKSQQRKSMEQLLADYREHQRLVGKNFIHRGSGASYQLLALAHTESGNDLVAVYCLNAMSRLKFTRPIAEFLDRFEEGLGIKQETR
ncbi:hypothetical protein NUH86_01645 [Sphingobium sp. JS3065]|uniref:hypothetical protein n=1 Tax=Sphingobium sp. JS3065 TaxID=2970925 RepID=UPI002263B37B|nr:hypothetical protein [Sphingobium sp. JS3065]UZW55534.1 hypothetical protein NUH86_01645 [Sphingobium sp. JS3065]